MRNVTTEFLEDSYKVYGTIPLVLVQIDHPDLVEPVRVARGYETVVSNGDDFIGINFNIMLPDDPNEGNARAEIVLDNVGRELMEWLELSNGAEGATATIMVVSRATPSTIEYSIIMDLMTLSVTPFVIRASLAFEDLINRPLIRAKYDERNAPGLFS